MANKVFNTRLQQKRATQAQWEATSGFIPLAGEIIIYEPDGNYNYPRMKVGDGVHIVAALPFVTTTVNGKIGAINLTAQDVGADEEGSAAAALGVAREEIEAIPQADWNENDETSKAYVANRTHWVETKENLPETIIEEPADNSGEWQLTSPFTVIPEVGKTYRVTWKGTDYDCVAQEFNLEGVILPTLGNMGMVQGTGDNGMPFAIAAFPAEIIELIGAHAAIYPLDGSTGSITLAIQEEVIHKIPEKFIAQPDWNASEGEEGYIANKTHGVFGGKDVYSERTLSLTDNQTLINDPYINCPTAGETCIVTWNGVEYFCPAVEFTDNGVTAIALGNAGAAGLPGADVTGEPFIIIIPTPDSVEGAGYYAVALSLEDLSSVTMAIRTSQSIQKLDWKFMHHSDWNAEKGEVGYIENRTHWVNKNEVIILPETSITADMSSLTTPPSNYPIPGQNYVVNWNGVEYLTKTQFITYEGITMYIFGNGVLYGGEKTDDPFTIVILDKKSAANNSNQHIVVNFYDGSDSVTFSISIPAGYVFKLDKKYLPNDTIELDNTLSIEGKAADAKAVGEAINAKSDFSGNYNDLTNKPSIPSIEGLATETYVNTAISNLVDSSPETLNTLNELAAALGDDPNFATTVATEIGKKVDKTTTVNGKALSGNINLSASDVGADATGTAQNAINALYIKNGPSYGSLKTVGAKEVSGSGAFAEGQLTTASGQASHAEGHSTIASGLYSHTEGHSTIASGQTSHAEGHNTIASAIGSHAEGYGATYPIKLSGDANTTVYTYTTNSASNLQVGCVIGLNLTFATITEFTETTITLNKTLSTVALSETDANIYVGIANGHYSHAEGDSATASGQMSHAEGHNTIASGHHSHAEGQQTVASGQTSHAEGKGTMANGMDSHAEGRNTIAIGDCSHAEGGDSTTASGYYSHAEGRNTIAIGSCSHAEGRNTTAGGDSSHAEGLQTIANGAWSHAQGKYNIKDIHAIYAHIVGNGSLDLPSNAHTLDWNGNAWFAGDVYVGSTSGTNKDDGSLKLATESYVDTLIAGIPYATDSEILAMMIEEDAFPVIQTEDGFVLCSAENEIMFI